jgi:signal transduction histidine kinase
MLELSILLISITANTLVGLTVLLKNVESATNRLFALLAFGLSAWSLASYSSIHTATGQLSLIRITMFFVVLMNSAFFFLVQVFPNTHAHFGRKLKLFALYCLVTLSVTLSPLLFTHLLIAADGSLSPQPGPGMLLFLIHVVVSVVGGPIFLIRKYIRSRGVERNQLRFLLVGTLIMFSLLPLTNFILPLAFGYSSLIPLSPLYTVIFSSCIAYGIIRHKLFDIRLVVARSLAYVLSITLLVAIYSGTTYVVINSILDRSASREVTSIINIVLLVFTGLSFGSIKRFFDKVTNKIFYQDAYDTQQFLDQLNRALVTNVELEPLLTKVSEVIVTNMKAEYSIFSLRETGYTAARNIGLSKTSKLHFNHEALQQAIPQIRKRVIVADDLVDDIETRELLKILRDNNAAVLVRLVSTLKYNLEGMGYLVLGPKKSGSPYSSQDVKVIRIIANELVIAIENALRFEEIEKFNITLQEKVDDATKKLRHTNDKLKQMDETKDEFISMASHQLRTPLTSVKGYLSMVLEGDAGDVPEMQQKLLNQAFVSSQRMVYLIADLLNVSRLRTGKFVIEAVQSNLADVVEGEVSQLKETAAGRGLELTFDKPADFPVLYLDETKIRQVIMNFTDNAIYYTPRGGHITVKLEDKGESIEFTVNDQGMGVPKSEQPHLFSKFYRAENARKARPDGTGLGLFMAKKVIVAQGGSIIFHSQEGKGSTFGFAFPKAKLQLPPSEQPQVAEPETD